MFLLFEYEIESVVRFNNKLCAIYHILEFD